MAKKALLALHDLARHFEDRALPLVKCLDQPVGVGQSLAQPGARVLAIAGPAHFEIIAAVDDKPGQSGGIERNVPAVPAFSDEDIGHHRLGCTATEAQARLGVIAFQFGEHVRKVFVVDLTQPLEPGEFAARHKLEIGDQPFHAGIEAVRLSRLQFETFGQTAGADAGGIKPVDQHQRASYNRVVHPERRCSLVK